MKPRTLEQMQHRSTCYEVGLYVSGKQVKTLTFAARKTNRSLLEAVWQNGSEIKPILTEEELDSDYSVSRFDGVVFHSGRVTVRFTGKTERECATEALRLTNAKL